LACAIIADAIEHQDHALVASPAFAALLEMSGVQVSPDVCRAAIRARWLADRGRP
jgi:hypothetical protein